MRAAIIENGIVTNVIVVDSLNALPGLINGEGAAIGHTWDGVKFSKPATSAAALADLKAAKNSAINDWREQANLTTFTHAGKAVACDSLSRSDIDGVANSIALFGAFPANFPGAWKAVDNSYIPMASIDDFKAMYASMTAQGSANFARAQALKAQLANAKTQADLDAITWS